MATKSMVTGSEGFVGRHLVAALIARGDEVSAVDVAETPHRGDMRYTQLDIRDAVRTRELMAGHDVVFHNASVVHTRQTAAEMVHDVNAGGTQTVIAGCREHAVPRLVYVSSASVVYEGRDIEAGDESLPYARKSQAPYADSKIAAERAVLAANGLGLATCAIRPHVIFGPGDTRFLPAILGRARAGKLGTGVGMRRKLSDFTYITNLIDGLLAADVALRTEGAAAAGEAYFVTNGEPRVFFDFVGQVLAGLELPPVRRHVPFRLAYTVAGAAELLDRLRGRELVPETGMSRFAIRYLCTHHYFRIEKAKRDLDWSPAVGLDEGIERTLATLRA
ncbi:MAG: NAD-dependent epimerase/dehydratase family protein [Sandaracinaceae bacterium]